MGGSEHHVLFWIMMKVNICFETQTYQGYQLLFHNKFQVFLHFSMDCIECHMINQGYYNEIPDSRLR